MLATLIAAALHVYTPVAQPADNLFVVFVDDLSIAKTVPDGRDFWEMSVFRRSKKARVAAYSLSMNHYDCLEKTVQTTNVTFYAANGNVLRTWRYFDAGQPIAPESIGEAIESHVCADVLDTRIKALNDTHSATTIGEAILRGHVYLGDDIKLRAERLPSPAAVMKSIHKQAPMPSRAELDKAFGVQP